MTSKHHPRKRFGQHFIHNEQVLQQILMAINPQSHDHLVEIGPGQGALTQILAPTCQQLDLIELDRDLVPDLQQQYGQQAHITIHQQDALTFDFSALVKNKQKLRIVGNLPYNISTPLLFHLFDQLDAIQDMHFMLQKEVVTRLTAVPGDHDYSRLSVMTQYFCHNNFLFDVPASAFTPPPKVESAVVRFNPRPANALTARDINALTTVVREAFTYRRKTLANALKKIITGDQLLTLGIDPKSRPQQLTVEDFVKISNHTA